MAEATVAPPGIELKKEFTITLANSVTELNDITEFQIRIQGSRGSRALRWWTTPTYRAMSRITDPRFQDHFALLMMDSKCRQTLLALLCELTADTAVVEIGPLPSEATHPESVSFGTYWNGKLRRQRVGAVSGAEAWYPTYTDLKEKFKISEATKKMYSAISDMGAEGSKTDLDDYTWLAAWIHDMHPRFAANFIKRWQREFSHWLILGVEKSSTGEVNVEWNPEVFDARFDPSDLDDETDPVLGGVLIDYLETDEESYHTDFDGTTFQDDISDSLIEQVCVNEEGFEFNRPGDDPGEHSGTVTDEDVSEWFQPPDDVIPFDVTSEGAADTVAQYTLVKTLPSQETKIACQHLEDNSNCLAIAMDLGVASQTSAKSFLKNGAVKYATKGAKGYKTQTIKVGVKSTVDQELTQAKIPKYAQGGLKSVALERNKILLGYLKQTFFSDPENLPPSAFEKDGTKWYIIASGLAGYINPNYGDSRLSYSYPDNEPLGSCETGKDFFESIYGSRVHFPLIFSEAELAGSSAKQFNLMNDVVIGMKHYTLDALDAAGKMEYDHCVERYKKLAKEGAGGPVTSSDGSYWWLLLLLIPVVGIGIAIALGSRKKEDDTAQRPAVVVIQGGTPNEGGVHTVTTPHKEIVSL